MKKNGFQVLEARDGKEGYHLFKTQKPDMILCDIIMPTQDGIETIMKIRKDSRKMLIIAISGGGRINRKDYLKLAKMAGANHVLQKPFDVEELLSLVRA